MQTDEKVLSRDVVEDVRAACETSGRATTEAEVRRTLEALDAQQVDAVRRLARGGLTAPLGPDALVDVAAGTPVHVASAREIGGYYEMKAQRDALATIAARTQGLSASATAHAPVAEKEDSEAAADDDSDYDEDVPDDDWDDAPSADDGESWDDDASWEEDDDEEAYAAAARDAASHAGARARQVEDDDIDEADEYEAADEPPDALAEAPKKAKRRGPPTKEDREQEQILMTLFAYHRDAVRVAQELGVGLQELADRIEALSLRRRIHRLLEQTTDIDVFAPSRVAPASNGNPAPVVRKRGVRSERPSSAGEDAVAAFERSMPAARTEPVNAHGTRVYRRSPESAPTPPARTATTNGLAVRREYVREPKRRARVAPPRLREVPKPEAPKAPSHLPFSELQGPGGRSVLDKLLADEKANPRVLAARLAERYEGPASRALNESDLRALLRAHGLADRFHELETVNTRFLLGFHQGARAKLANALQMSAAELDAYLSRLRLSEELERIRAERSRIELGRKRIHDRIVQVLTRAPYLDDLGVLPVIDREVREHVTALFEQLADAGDAAHVAELVRTQLGVEPNAFAKLLRRYEMADRLPTSG